MSRLHLLLAGLVSCGAALASTAWAEDAAGGAAKPSASLPTHKQIRSIRTVHNGQPIHLNTYCLSPAGDILACVGGSNYVYKQDANGNYTAEAVNATAFVQVYSAEGELKSEWAVPFKPTAINVAKDQTIFVAGDGKMARLSLKGELLTVADTPNLGDPAKFREEAIARAKEQNAEFVTRLEKQISFAKEQAQKIEVIAEAERTASQKARLAAYNRQLELYQTQLDGLRNQTVEVAAAAAGGSGGKTVTALAVSDEHVFVCSQSMTGHGYDVFRCDYDFSNAKQVLSGLSGCCGQMDIQAMADRLVVAENTKFQVSIHDEDGKSLSAFGSRDRSGGAGFGSCCNPMNVRCCDNGDILTAESSIGDIKRFSSDGKLVSYIGRAKISGGCKHVALAWDAKLDRYYMMNVSDSTICVLVPRSQAPEFTEDELAAKAAREGLGLKLVGEWAIPGTKAKQRSALGSALRTLLGAGEEPAAAAANVPFERATFSANGKLSIAGGMFGQWNVTTWEWAAVRQNVEKQTVDFEMLMDGIQYQALRVEILSDSELRISLLSGDQVSMGGKYARVTAEAAPAEAAPAQSGTPQPVSVEPAPNSTSSPATPPSAESLPLTPLR